MEELYVEGLATRGGPESCAGVREDAGEALTGVRAGRGIEPRNERFGVPTPSRRWKATSLTALFASRQGTPRGLRAMACTQTFMCENRESPGSARLVDHQAGRLGNTQVVSPR